MKKILITGGDGYIGTYLKRNFEELGYEIYTTTRRKQNVSEK